jgi:sugar phosphate isomerase/epimerase
LNAVSGRIATIHLNDLASVEPLAFARVGEGIVPLEEMVRAVYATGYEGPICIEEAGFQGWEGTVKAVEYTCQLREAIQK